MSKNKTEYTPTEARELLDGVSKNSFYNDMNEGRISYDTRPWGQKKRRYIQGSELARFYGDKFKPQRLDGTTQKNETGQTTTLQQNIKTTPENKLLEQKVEFLNERLGDKEKIIQDKDKLLAESREREKDLSGKLDKSQTTIERQTYLLDDHRTKEPEKTAQANNNFNAGRVGGNSKKAIRGQKTAQIVVIFLIVVAVASAVFTFRDNIENAGETLGFITAEIPKEDLNTIAPAAGGMDEKKIEQGTDFNYQPFIENRNFTPIPEDQ